jgi:hypothetical protein
MFSDRQIIALAYIGVLHRSKVGHAAYNVGGLLRAFEECSDAELDGWARRMSDPHREEVRVKLIAEDPSPLNEFWINLHQAAMAAVKVYRELRQISTLGPPSGSAGGAGVGITDALIDSLPEGERADPVSMSGHAFKPAADDGGEGDDGEGGNRRPTPPRTKQRVRSKGKARAS